VLAVAACLALAGGGGGTLGFFTCLISWVAEKFSANSLMNCLSLSMAFWLTPLSCKPSKICVQDESTPVEENPDFSSKPMCARCLKEPDCGPEIMDLSIFPGFFFFFFSFPTSNIFFL
jgi:hypothetical protein